MSDHKADERKCRHKYLLGFCHKCGDPYPAPPPSEEPKMPEQCDTCVGFKPAIPGDPCTPAPPAPVSPLVTEGPEFECGDCFDTGVRGWTDENGLHDGPCHCKYGKETPLPRKTSPSFAAARKQIVNLCAALAKRDEEVEKWKAAFNSCLEYAKTNNDEGLIRFMVDVLNNNDLAFGGE